MHFKSIILLAFCALTFQGISQTEIVMLGHVGQRNAEIWVHWPNEGENVSLQYSNPNWNGGEISFSVLKEKHLSNKIILYSLQPSKTYTFFLKSKSFQNLRKNFRVKNVTKLFETKLNFLSFK